MQNFVTNRWKSEMMSPVETNMKDGVFTITLSRPKQYNALNWEMLNQLRDAIASTDGNDQIRCVVIEGKGDNFMAGGDIVYFNNLIESSVDEKRRQFSRLISEVHRLVEMVAESPIPFIAKVRGAAAGFGISLVAGCDLAFGSRNSFYTSAYNLLGTSPDGGSTFYLPRSVGMKKAMEIVLTTNRYSAPKAVEIGLINDVIDADKLDIVIKDVASQISKSARRAVANTKSLIRQSLDNDLGRQLQLEQEYFLECAVSNDFAEGVRAFVEKRAAYFE